VSQPI